MTIEGGPHRRGPQTGLPTTTGEPVNQRVARVDPDEDAPRQLGASYLFVTPAGEIAVGEGCRDDLDGDRRGQHLPVRLAHGSNLGRGRRPGNQRNDVTATAAPAGCS